jgi:hypothetical protein
VSSERNDSESPQPAQPGDDVLMLTDPKTMRAMAHPLRMALTELFAVHETLTATQASEALGESPATCAFHLRTLAKYGFLEEAGGGRGRERPWKPTTRSIRVETTELPDKQAEIAAEALAEVWIDRQLARIRDSFSADKPSREWAKATGSIRSVVFLTAAEAAALQEELNEIVHRYTDRLRNPSLRPPGALPVELDVFGFLRQDLAALLPGADQDGPAQGS